MNRDGVSESPVKRQKTQHRPVQRSQHGRNLSSQDAFRQNTIPTQPLPHPPVLGQGGGFSVAGLLSQINSGSSPSPYITQPTQPMTQRRYNTSTPTVEVNRSSPPPGAISSPTSQVTPRKQVAPSSGLKRPGMGSRLAPAGTRFQPPPGTVARPKPITILDDEDDDDIRDPPIDRSSDDELQPMRSIIRPTEFTRGGRNLDSSPNRVQESPQMRSVDEFKSITSQFAYDPSAASASAPRRNHGDLASSYGSTTRNKPAPVARLQTQTQPDISLDDILDIDTRGKVEQMRSILPQKSIRDLELVLRRFRGNYFDALNHLSEEAENPKAVVDLTSSDNESNASRQGPRPIKGPLRPAAKQEVKAPARTIQEKYNAQAKAKPLAAQPTTEPRKRRLVQGGGRNTSASRTSSPSPQKPAGLATKKMVTVIDSDSETEADVVDPDEEEDQDFNYRLLKYFNTCSAQDLADLSAEKLAVAEFIIARRPFSSLDAVCEVSDAAPTKTGKRSTKKPIGEKVYDVCSDMMQGYEAVDLLVGQCDDIGKPIFDTMQQWGIDIAAASKEGELALTNLEESLQDSGIGTPASSIHDDDDDDIVRPKSKPKKKNVFLKKPAIMHPDLVLKDYQLFGLNWLNLLWSKKLSCILADDMGLGKTCQVITFLAHLKETGVQGPHLIVVPGSTLENWIRELQRFCPALNVSPYYGSLNEREEWREAYEDGDMEVDVIVTTYETATGKLDAPFFRKVVKPVVAVFDEGHHLKNSQSKRHIELMRIPAEFRLLLTGTPLQNNLQELVSLLAFILPKLISSEIREDLNRIFKYKATTKDADHAALLSAQRIRRARSMMTPFILRRKKAQVLKHLPAKHRRVEYCEMPPEQKDIYSEMVAEAVRVRDLPLAQKPRGGSAKYTQEMTALRFAALHPLLLRHKYGEKDLQKLQKALERTEEYGSNRPDQIAKFIKEDLKGGDFGLHKFCLGLGLERFALKNDEWMVSGKVQKLKKLMEAYIKNGDRVLVFSQFTTMMNILEAVFENLNIKFMRLDGSTLMSTRQDIIDQFTNDTTIPVFMLSTKAGGAGINLACANKVIIFDSSFNPQDDIQAENRAHRVGQTREVEVVRLVTRGTIEEQIHALGESKLALDERVAGATGESGAAEKKAEAEGESKVEEMFFKALEQVKVEESEKKDGVKEDKENEDTTMAGMTQEKDTNVKEESLKDQFKNGLLKAGLDVN